MTSDRGTSLMRWTTRILRWIWGLQLLGVGIWVFYSLFGLFNYLFSGSASGWPVGATVRLDDIALEAERANVFSITGELWVIAPTVREWLPFTAYVSLAMVLWLWGFHAIRSIVATAGSGEPFLRENIGRVRVLGLILVVWGLVMPGIGYLVSLQIVRLAAGAVTRVSPAFDMNWMLAVLGLVLLVLAGVFRRGNLLEQDRDLTI